MKWLEKLNVDFDIKPDAGRGACVVGLHAGGEGGWLRALGIPATGGPS